MDKIFSLATTADARNVAVIRNFFAEALRNVFGEEDIIYIEMCLNEMCENIIRHAYGEGHSGPISIRMKTSRERVEISVIDRGKPFNVLDFEPPDNRVLVEQGIKGKLGIKMMRKICDKILYKRLKGKNKTVFIRKRHSCSPAA
ncbi:MAG TPA: ATP-binding protein, partial [Candidatus Goldiibacteriota bacterium]|nr:ATP-binding protein [Candidatus Goldiibacteriota bacterium]